MVEGVTEFIDEVCAIKIKNGVAVVTYPNGVRRATPLSIFRTNIASCRMALEEFDASKSVVSIRGRGSGH